MDPSTNPDPTRPLSPPLKDLGDALEQYLQGTGSIQDVRGALQVFEEKLQLLELTDVAGTERGEPGVLDVLGLHQALLQEYHLGLEDLRVALAAAEPATIKAAFQRMTESDIQLGQVFQTIQQRHVDYEERAEAARTFTCPRCGTRNPRGQSSCSKCRFMLPQTYQEREETDIVGGSADEPIPSVTELRGLAERWIGESDPHPLLNRLQAFRNLYEGAASTTQEVLSSGRCGGEVSAVIQQTVAVLQALIQSTDQVGELVEQGNPGMLEDVFEALEDHWRELETLRLQFARLARP